MALVISNLDPLEPNLDCSLDGDSAVPPASDGSYCSSSMQALVASEDGRRRGLVDAAMAESWDRSEGVGSTLANLPSRSGSLLSNIIVEMKFEVRRAQEDATRVARSVERLRFMGTMASVCRTLFAEPADARAARQ